MPARLNVEPDPALAAEVAYFLKWGYVVLKQPLDPSTLATLRSAVDDLAAKYRFENATGDAWQGLFHQVLEEDERFHALLMYAPVFDFVQQILGTCVQLHSGTGRIVLPGTKDQPWHRDTPWPVDPAGTPIGAIPSQMNAIYYLDDVDDAIGPTVLLPGSHKAPFRAPDGSVRCADEVRITGKAGTIALVNNYLFHRGIANTSTRSRRTLLFCYQNAWMKSRETFDGPLTAGLREKGSPTMRLLLGAVERW